MAKDRLSIRKRRPGAPKPWEARWRDPDGKQRSRSFRTKREAENHLATVKADMLRGQYVDQAAGKVRFRAYPGSTGQLRLSPPGVGSNGNAS